MTTRDVLISAMRGRLIDQAWPRIVTLVILSLSGGAAFGASAATLRLGLDSMALRYPLATTVGYLTFIVLIRVWIALHRDDEIVPDPFDVLEVTDAVHEVLPDPSGGAPESGWFDVGLDLEEAWFLVIAIACALAGLLAVAYVVYIAPVLLAEVALDAALISTVYRRLRREDAGWWAASAIRRTAAPAIILIAFMGITGFALEQVAPDARSIGGVIEELIR